MKKKEIFILIIIIAITSAIVTFVITNLDNEEYSSSLALKEEKEENPYKITNKYDGTYYFKLESTSYFWAFGIITFDKGNCQAQYVIPSKSTTYSDEYKFKGYCGLDENDNFIFNLNDGRYIYKCEKSDVGLNCVLSSQYDLTSNTEEKLTLSILNNSENIDSFYTQYTNKERINWKTNLEQREAEEKAKKEAEEKAQKEAEENSFKESCKTYTFEQIARNPDNFKGTNVKLTGEVIQTMYDINSVNLRVNITKKGSYSTYYTDTIYVTYNTTAGEDKILKNDIITIYGTSMGDCSYKTVLGSEVTLPLISAKYITRVK